ncbi:Rieske (2Fe-2S) protein [Streptomyces sp. V3I7]|uniref:Rieske (2Fe-2S) protein n=1 Tax=Streptomyces sp. V3I7 TaxID=3042278 RepID=UPI002784EFB8|nr:Rieske (2Fe-2S) protein [Streptomyces sp. V3I7]MDQ0990071.1 Rieske Fe-S protein [Streptomyces sp. V3I7]
MTHSSTRRTALATGAAALAAGCVGCSSNGNGSASAASTPASGPASTPVSQTSAATSAASSDTAAGHALTTTADIPVGGGRIFEKQKVVVTQPKKGEFKAFSAICTHQGCTVTKVADGTIDCPCHGSKFEITDGAVAHGPATRPLPEEKIMVEGNSIHLA